MDLLPSPGDDCNEVPDDRSRRFHRFRVVEATDDCFRQFGQALSLTGRSDLDEVEEACLRLDPAPLRRDPSKAIRHRRGHGRSARARHGVPRARHRRGGGQPEGSCGDATRSDGTRPTGPPGPRCVGVRTLTGTHFGSSLPGGVRRRRIVAPVHVPSTRAPHLPSAENASGGDRRLTLVLGLLARADDVTGDARDRTAPGRRSHEDRTIGVNLKLKEASLSAIEAAQVLADACFCQSHEAVVLDRILSVIDELDDAIRALHEPDQRPRHCGSKVTGLENAQAAFRRVFVPAGRGAMFRLGTSRYHGSGRGERGESDES